MTARAEKEALEDAGFVRLPHPVGVSRRGGAHLPDRQEAQGHCASDQEASEEAKG